MAGHSLSDLVYTIATSIEKTDGLLPGAADFLFSDGYRIFRHAGLIKTIGPLNRHSRAGGNDEYQPYKRVSLQI
jgi:hypothetical protein